MIIDNTISKAVESCIAHSHESCCKQYQKLGKAADFMRVGSGIANFTGHESFLSQVIGWGFDSDSPQQELIEIEDFYRKLHHHIIDIELSPLCGNRVIEALSNQGFRVSEVSNISVLDLANHRIDKASENHHVFATAETDVATWASCVAEGFACPDAASQFAVYAQSQNIHAYHAIIDDSIAACATIAIHGDICDLGVTSTLQEFRGRGLQKALIEHRLDYAKGKGIRLATVTTEPGSISDLNVQKCGFQCAYTRIKFSKNISD